MKKNLIFFFAIAITFFSLTIHAAPFEPDASYSVCFTPGGNCTQNIVNAINNAKNSVFVQAYSFTSRPIGNALVAAKKRGVNVEVIFDKSILNRPNTAWFFIRHGIPVLIDSQPAIAHNKVMVIDQKYVVTGSFNFTYAAQEKNAENVLIIQDAELAKKYLVDWNSRKALSYPMKLSAPSPHHSNSLEEVESWLMWRMKSLLRSS